MSPVKRIAALQNPSASLIFLHGLGDTGEGWSGILSQELHQSADLRHVNLILPTAPVQFVSCFGEKSTSWFDIKASGALISRDNDGFFDSIDLIKQLIQKEVDSGISANRIVVGGFSQGGALTLGSAITLDTKLAGFIDHSGFLIDQLNVEPKQKPANINTPLLMIHGKSDDIVDFKIVGEPSYKTIKDKVGLSDITWRPYPGLTHSASLETINDMKAFLKKVVPSN